MSISVTIESAIAHVRHVIQEHAPSDFVLGGSANLEDVRWLANLLGWELPEAYYRTIQVHDGVFTGLDMDECGNYWLMNIRQQDEFPPGTVFFYDHETDSDRRILTNAFAATYPGVCQNPYAAQL